MLSSSSVTGFSVEKAVQQPQSVEHINHEDPEQQLSDGAPLSAAVCGLRTRWEHVDNEQAYQRRKYNMKKWT